MPHHQNDVAREGQKPTPPVFDPYATFDRLDGDVELFRMLAALFEEDALPMYRKLREAAEREDLREIQRMAHSLKGLAANFDGADAVQAALVIESHAKAGELAAAAAAIPALEPELDRLRRALAEFNPDDMA